MKERNSYIEVYRILAVFSVLIAHYNGWFLGGIPDSFDFNNPTSQRVGQIIIAALCACCVNCFLLISGYFGIKLRVQSVVKFLILLLGIYIPMYCIDCLLNGTPIFSKMLVYNCMVVTRGGYFVQCYFMLMIFSPILNAFIENYQKKAVWLILVILIIEFWFDCIVGKDRMGFTQGYSVAHFCLIYLVGRLIFLYKDKITEVRRYKWVVLYFVFSVVIAGMYLAKVKFTFYYSNPAVIATGIFSFLPFIYKYRTNKIINWVASGTFAVYLIQVTEPVFSFLCETDKELLANNSYILYLLKSSVLLVTLFAVCVLYDKLRAWCSQPLINFINKRIDGIKSRYQL